jgi:23S rRNA (cytosine1962-C5)-methyltransferase
MDSVNPTVRLRLRVKPAAERALRSGHPWLFAEGIQEQNRPGRMGEIAVLYDQRDRFFGLGLFDPGSALRVRMLHVGRAQAIDRSWWHTRWQQSLARREGLFDAQTNGYRCIHGESDGWPGLVLDRYDQTLVLKLYTAAWLPRLPELVQLIAETLRPARVVLRLSRNIRTPAAKHSQAADGQIIFGDSATTLPTFLETGLRFEVDVYHGQKTGFFLDQRENRRQVGLLAEGREVLNVFSYSGGFSLYAARGKARSVTDLDLSPHALASARRNFELNRNLPQVAQCRHRTLEADAFEWLAGRPEHPCGLVILDPPSFAQREADRPGALQAYARLATGGIARLAKDGLLVAASCSAHVTATEFFAAVTEAARKSRRQFQQIQTTGHPADHPATFREALYLKCIYLRFL